MDRRYMRTHETIRKTYMELIQKKETLKVSISEIARAADIDRKTFYLHYPSVESILDEFLEERLQVMASVLEEHRFFEEPFDVQAVLQVVDSTRESDLQLLKAISGSSSYEELWHRFRDSMTRRAVEVYGPKFAGSSTAFQVCVDFFISGILYVYRKYLQEEYDGDIREITEILTQMAHFGVQQILEKQ